ncbi:diaminopimelate epimerase [Actinocorallia populi]|uniref:diaminopimelate epimerase n=1 Tax=Actinocorallia populi TaxID=2079200 RepID=UPI000D08FE64|nr:diaminopimelate epimerase [Actinocorallia populi]
MPTLSVTKTHGSRNEIFVIDGAPDALLPAGDVARAVERLCDRELGLGGDGAYFVEDGGDGTAQAWFFNPDGSPSLLCGNGMRAVGRLLLDRHGADGVLVRTGPYAFAVRHVEPTPHGVRQVSVELPPVDFAPAEPIVAGVAYPFVDRELPAYHPSRTVTAVAVPNSHLITVVDAYDENELVATGRRVAADTAAFPIGANASFVLPLAEEEVFVHTFERGAGLTPSCGSGIAASRSALSRLGLVEPDRPVLVRNPGGPARSRLQERDGRWQPLLEGNATIVYRTELEPSALLGEGALKWEEESDPAEAAAFSALYEENAEILRSRGVHPSSL